MKAMPTKRTTKMLQSQEKTIEMIEPRAKLTTEMIQNQEQTTKIPESQDGTESKSMTGQKEQ